MPAARVLHIGGKGNLSAVRPFARAQRDLAHFADENRPGAGRRELCKFDGARARLAMD